MTDPGADGPVPPAPPAEFVRAARLAPGHWLYLGDPAWQGEGTPPDWAVVGQWRSDSAGDIVEWEDNEGYRPSPGARGWPEPADEVDRAVQLATTGYGPAEGVTAALAGTEVAVLVTADGEPVSASAPDGTAVVPVYTSPRHLRAAGLGYVTLPVADLLARMPPGHSLLLNSSAAVGMVLATDGLAEALRDAAEPGQEGAGGREGAGEWTEAGEPAGAGEPAEAPPS
ncbi:type VII secretion system-associated protein [Streptomyces sp. NPDC086010]|uniref:type VII secretion system-associated protein n=1 Tax=Streptomyces sp. NPDC086010 TaxID=3365745 RepID=UPI0037D47C24